MKTLKPLLILAALIWGCFKVHGQTDAKAKKEAMVAAIKQAIADRTFEFVPEYARVDGGQETLLQKEYTLVFKNGRIISHLPSGAYGHKVLGLELNENKVDFESTKNDITVTEKKGTYNMLIQLKDCREARQIYITINPDGKYSSVRVLSYSADTVNFTGRIRTVGTAIATSAE